MGRRIGFTEVPSISFNLFFQAKQNVNSRRGVTSQTPGFLPSKQEAPSNKHVINTSENEGETVKLSTQNELPAIC